MSTTTTYEEELSTIKNTKKNITEESSDSDELCWDNIHKIGEIITSDKTESTSKKSKKRKRKRRRKRRNKDIEGLLKKHCDDMNKATIASLAKERIAELRYQSEYEKQIQKDCEAFTYSPDGGKTRKDYSHFFKTMQKPSIFMNSANYSDEMVRTLAVEFQTRKINSRQAAIGLRNGARINIINQLANKVSKKLAYDKSIRTGYKMGLDGSMIVPLKRHEKLLKLETKMSHTGILSSLCGETPRYVKQNVIHLTPKASLK